MTSPKAPCLIPLDVSGFSDVASRPVVVAASESDFYIFDTPRRVLPYCVGHFFSKEEGAITRNLGKVIGRPILAFQSCSASTTATNSHN